MDQGSIFWTPLLASDFKKSFTAPVHCISVDWIWGAHSSFLGVNCINKWILFFLTVWISSHSFYRVIVTVSGYVTYDCPSSVRIPVTNSMYHTYCLSSFLKRLSKCAWSLSDLLSSTVFLLF